MGQIRGYTLSKMLEIEVCGKYIQYRQNEEISRIKEGQNGEIEKRYDRYIDYG